MGWVPSLNSNSGMDDFVYGSILMAVEMETFVSCRNGIVSCMNGIFNPLPLLGLYLVED